MDGIDVLHLEDSKLDADLVRVRLEREGFIPKVTRVDTREAFVSALETGRYDVILADYSLPGFDGVSALQIAQERVPDCPFILVSATLGEEFAVECLRLGATDYIVKQRMERLGAAIRRAIEEATQHADKLRSEAELRESREQLALALEAAKLGSWEMDLATGEIRCDSVCRANLGFSPEDLMSRSLLSAAIHPEDREYVDRSIGRSVDEHSPLDVEWRWIEPDGQTRWVMLRGRVLLDDQGMPARLMGVSLDITPRKLAEVQLRESERRYRLLAEALPQLVWTALPDGSIDYLSGQWCAYTGIPEAEQLGFDAFEAIHPDDRDAVIERWLVSVAQGKLFEAEHRIRREDGIYRWFQTRAVPLKNAFGVVRWFGTSTDVHDRKLAEEERARVQQRERRRSQQVQKLADVATRLNAALDVGSVAGVVTEEARSILDANQARTSVVIKGDWAGGFHRESLSAQYASWQGRRFAPDGSGLAGFACLANKSLRLTESELAEHPDSIPDDGPPARGWLSAPLIDRTGENLGLIQLSDRVEGEFSDDDEAVLVQLAHMASVAIENARFYHELKDKDRKKDEFLAMLAHELRNPVAGVSNAVTLLRLSDDKENRRWAIDVVERQFKQLARLIDDLLDVSRITSGKIRLKKERLDTAAVLDQAIESVRSLIQERRHTLETEYPRGTLTLEADPTRLEQVVVNLLTNAAKYTEPGGRIRLTAEREGSSVVIAVEDNGMGISTDKLPQMFELFAQGERSIARSEGGLGIGLTVVKKLTEMHGGSIVAVSGGIGKGSRFAVRLPSAGPARSMTPLPASRLARTEAAQGVKILVVDDNVDTVSMLAKLLTLLGNEVRLAFEGKSALEVAASFIPDFILLDIGLPGMDGYEVAAALRKDPRFDRSVIVAVSGYGREEDLRKSREMGFDHHLIKPVDHDRLLSILMAGAGTNLRDGDGETH